MDDPYDKPLYEYDVLLKLTSWSTRAELLERLQPSSLVGTLYIYEDKRGRILLDPITVYQISDGLQCSVEETEQGKRYVTPRVGVDTLRNIPNPNQMVEGNTSGSSSNRPVV